MPIARRVPLFIRRDRVDAEGSRHEREESPATPQPSPATENIIEKMVTVKMDTSSILYVEPVSSTTVHPQRQHTLTNLAALGQRVRLRLHGERSSPLQKLVKASRKRLRRLRFQGRLLRFLKYDNGRADHGLRCRPFCLGVARFEVFSSAVFWFHFGVSSSWLSAYGARNE